MATFTNQASLSYNGTTTTSNITTGELIEVLTMTKNAVDSDYEVGDTITYTVNAVNSSSSAFTGLTLTDNLGMYTLGSLTLYPLTYVSGSVQYYVNGVLQSTPTATAGPPLAISGLSIPAGGNISIVYQATVNKYANPQVSGTITNTASLSGASISTPITASETIETDDDAELTISKGLCPTSVAENGQVTYTFTIQNTGNTAASAADGVVLSDTFNPVLNPISVTYNGTTWAPTNYTYNTTTGVFTTNSGKITVPAATYTQNATTGAWTMTPGVTTIAVTGTV